MSFLDFVYSEIVPSYSDYELLKLNSFLPSFDPTLDSINPYFDSFKSQIQKYSKQRSSSLFETEVSAEEYIGLFSTCKQHINLHKNDLDVDNVLVFTHPFYMYIADIDHVTSFREKRDSNNYLSSFFEVLNKKNDLNQTKIVILETPHHYAALTNLLLEEKLVDDVILTKFDSGYAAFETDLDKFSEKNVFIAGGYNFRCLDASILDIKKIEDPVKKIVGISDLSLNSPLDNRGFLKPSFLNELGRFQSISSKNLLKKLHI